MENELSFLRFVLSVALLRQENIIENGFCVFDCCVRPLLVYTTSKCTEIRKVTDLEEISKIMRDTAESGFGYLHFP